MTSFNLKDELKMPINMQANFLSKPQTYELHYSESYFDALKKERVAIYKLKSMSFGHRYTHSMIPRTA